MSGFLAMAPLLFGAWVMPGVDSGANQALPDQPSLAPQTLLHEQIAPNAVPPAAPLDMLRTQPTLAPANRNAPLTYYGTSPYADRVRPQSVPVPPTDPLLASPESPWAPPTESNSPFSTPGFGSRAKVNAGMVYGAPNGGAYATPGKPTFQPYSEAIAQQIQASRLQAAARTYTMPRASKPFSNYTPPSATSPYMNLYRPTTNGVVDNYTNLVRPQVQQERENQILNNQIRGLRTATRLNSAILQRAGASGRIGVPGYMNYGDYYQGITR